MCWRRLLKIPWTARRSSQLVLKECNLKFFGSSDAEAEAPILWPPDRKNWLSGKDPDAGQDWRQKEKGTTENEMVGWHRWLNGHEFEQAPGVGDGQGSLECCSPWGCKESDTAERLNWTQGKVENTQGKSGKKTKIGSMSHEIPLDCREIQPVHPKRNQSWVFIGRTDVEAETPILWPPDRKNWLIWKDPDAGKDWRQEGKGTAEHEMVGWHHQLNGPEFE